MANKALVSRSLDASANTLGVALETRRIVLAQGIQFNNTDLSPWPFMVMPNGLTAPLSARDKDWPKSMRKREPLALTGSGPWEYVNFAQGVKFTLEIVNTKSDFRNALLAPAAHVVYAGHARYGRGPCFGTSDAPGEDWENGTDPTNKGIFRMGYPFIGVPVKEVLEHGYTANLVASVVKVTQAEAEGDLKPYVGSLQAKKVADIDSGLVGHVTDSDPNKTFWAYRAPEEGKMEWFVVLHAGWTSTVSDPNDLGATTPECRVFCHFGCDTFKHNHTILRDSAFKGWKKGGGERFAYFTTSISNNITAVYWLYHLFTYSKQNAFQDWEPSLDYAVSKVNADLARDGETYGII